MRLVTLRTAAGTRAARLDGNSGDPDTGTLTVLDGVPDVGALLARPDWREFAAAADGEQVAYAGADLAPLVPRPGKVICAGLNYRTHILEMGMELPAFPTLFPKFAESLVGATDDIVLPPEDPQLDWEAELAVVIGTPVRRATEQTAAAAIAGWTVSNDVSMRGWQFRTAQWLAGKGWERSTPLGPALVTSDEWTPGPTIRATVAGELMQEASTDDLVFSPAALVAYVSTMITLQPGDVVLTGTPGGVGYARTPPRWLVDGELVEISIDGLGVLRNRVVAEA
jgi:acylpyruvate hydrolase